MNVSKNINASFSLRTLENGVTLRVPNSEGHNQEFVFEKLNEDDTEYLNRAEATFQQAIKNVRDDISSIKAEFESAFDKYVNENHEEEEVE